jgi:spermidine/putrescine transport system substrate-binding protein
VKTNRTARAAGACALLLLGACGKDVVERSGETPVLRLTIWTNYMPDEVLRDFEKEHGCRVETANYTSNDELLGTLDRGVSGGTGFDLAFPSDVYLPVLVSRGLIEPVDRALLKNVGNVDPEIAANPSAPAGSWSVPYTWGTVGIAWRTDAFATPPDSWSVFADRGATGGRAFLLAEARDVVAAALLANGLDVNAVEAASLGKAKETLLAWKSSVMGFTGEVKDHLASGEATVIEAYNGDAAQAMKESPGKFGFAVPKEGGLLWVDHFVVPKGAPHRTLAHRFIDHCLDPKVAARISVAIRYALANRAVAEHLPPDVRDDPAIYAPSDVRKRLHRLRDLGPDMRKVTDLFTEVRGS